MVLVIGLPASVLAAAGIGGMLLRQMPVELAMPWVVAALVTMLAGVGASAVAAHQFFHWRIPVRRLNVILKDLHARTAPVEELSQVEGGLAALVPALKIIAQDLRIRRSEDAQLDQEIRQRIENRTSALQRTIEALRHQASRDPLTGLYNRRMLDEHLPNLLTRCRADNVSVCVLMMDLDNFKNLNDTLGHAAGDDMLSAVGQLIRSGVRDQDLAFRCGGDEFVVVLPETPRDQAEALAKRLQMMVDDLSRPLRLARPLRISVGIAISSEMSDATAETLLKEADTRLYQQKFARKRNPTPPPGTARIAV
ncbi:MAG TPA: GGDEF domain-containing protein [Tepidisphaeraceae bacterium]|jgi:diguanylate cyclase (GGDEF)-like protein